MKNFCARPSGMYRRLSSSDVESVQTILMSVGKHSNSGEVVGGWSEAQVRSEMQLGIGWGAFSSTDKLEAFVFYRDLKDVWEITYLATVPCRWRSGVMSSLLSMLINLCPKGKSLWLEVHEFSKAACHLYEKLEFKQVGRRSHYYIDGAAALLYSRNL